MYVTTALAYRAANLNLLVNGMALLGYGYVVTEHNHFPLPPQSYLEGLSWEMAQL